MSTSIGTTTIKEIMITVIMTVNEKDKMEDVARVFQSEDINAAPVVNREGVCVGLITSRDLVTYEAQRQEMHNELAHGQAFDLARYGDSPELRWPGSYFDEVGYHMSKEVETAEPFFPLSRVARMMCRQHFHHMIVLDEKRHPIGLLSSLDILGFIIGEQVCRKPNCK